VNHEKIKIINFVQQYMSVIENYIEIFEDESIYLKPNDEDYEKAYDKMIDSISDFRDSKKVKEYLQSEGLGKNWLETVSKDKISTLSSIMNQLYGAENLPGTRNKSSFITTLFFKNTDLDKKVLEKYIQKINNFTLDKDINTLYNFTFLNENNNAKSVNIEDSKMKKHLTNIFKSLEKKDRAEIISSLNVFLELYENTDFGSKHIELINKEYQRGLNAGEEDAQRKWLDNILEAASSCSPSKIYNSINYSNNNGTGTLIKKTESGSRVDGLFFINSTKYNGETLKNLKNIESLKQLLEFKQKYKNEEQILICATSDKSIDIEKDTIIRHPLANMFLSKLLNSEMKKDYYFMSNFNNNIKGSFKDGNVNIRNAIVKAFRSIDYDNEIPDPNNKNYNAEEAYNKIQSKILKNPVRYINEDINKNLDLINEKRINDGLQELKKIEKKHLLTKEYFKEYIDLYQEDNGFNAHSYVCFFQKGNVHKSREVKERDVNIKKIKRLGKEEKIALIQYAALVKSLILKEDSEISVDLCNNFADSCLKLRCFSDKKTLKNDIFDKVKTDEIDIYVLETFVLSKDFEKNINFLDNNLKKNTSKIIDHVLKEYNEVGENSFLNKYGVESRDVFNRINYILENNLNLFHQDIKENIKSSLNTYNSNIEIKNRKEFDHIRNEILEKKYETNEVLSNKEDRFLKRIEELGFKILKVNFDNISGDQIALDLLNVPNPDDLELEKQVENCKKNIKEDYFKEINEKISSLFQKEAVFEEEEDLLSHLYNEGIYSIEQFDSLSKEEKIEVYESFYSKEDLKEEFKQDNNKNRIRTKP
tara:strand:- start:38519 stop:40972 length:2454 start_codon:yes stop_codon:yes gene_type:complete